MADIFISYSSKDRAQAEQLTELLASAGLSVWIDQSALDVATSWSAEIVDAINDCHAFIVLLSPNSIVSHNVIKEVSLASEKRKKILPLDLEPTALPRELEYQLAGIHRAPITNIDAIIRAIGKLGLEATQPPSMKLVKETDGRKSLMILPFEDLSPTGDNGWFADGIASELISALSKVKALRVADPQATKEFKSYKGQLATYAKEMGIQYFVHGDVRKFGDSIKITCRLLDIESGDFLWQESLKGLMAQVFDIQEEVANKVSAGLHIILTSEEKKKLVERGTENAEAYELTLRAVEYAQLGTKEGYQRMIQLCSEAIKLDPGFAKAYYRKAWALASLHRLYDHNPKLLDEAEKLCHEALALKPDLTWVYQALSMIYVERGMYAEGEAAAQEFVRKEPSYNMSHFALGTYYATTGNFTKAINAFEEANRIKPGQLSTLWNICVACGYAKEYEKRAYWSEVLLPISERYLRLHPDDEVNRVKHAVALHDSGRVEAAREAAATLSDLRDGNALYSVAKLFERLGNKPEALRSLRKSIEAGYRDAQTLVPWLNEENERTLADLPEYDQVKRMIEEIAAEAKHDG